jgi:hypothetical protein
MRLPITKPFVTFVTLVVKPSSILADWKQLAHFGQAVLGLDSTR